MKTLILIFLFLNSCILTPPILASEIQKPVKIASGKIDGLYYRTATYICKIIEKKENKKCEVVLTSGSAENYQLLKSKKVDLAIIQENFLTEEINLVGELYKEGIFLLYNSKTKITDIKQFNNLYTDFDSGSGNEKITYQYIKKVNKKETSNKDTTKDLCKGVINYKIFTIGLDKNIIRNYIKSCNLKVFSFSYLQSNDLYDLRKLFLDNEEIYVPTVKAILVSNRSVDDKFEFIFDDDSILNLLDYTKISKIKNNK